MSRTRRALVTALALTVVMSGGAQAVTVLDADFETADGTVYTGVGAGRDCATPANTGSCSVRLAPEGYAQPAVARTSVANGTMNGPSTVMFAFRGESTLGDVDSHVKIVLDVGYVLLDTTDSVAPNTYLGLTSDVDGPNRWWGSWPDANTWYSASITLDPVADTATASVLGHSSQVRISAGATRVVAVEFSAIRWSDYGWPMRYDSLKVDTGPAPNQPPTTTVHSPGAGSTLSFYGPHVFRVAATDPENEWYTAHVEIREYPSGALYDVYRSNPGIPSEAWVDVTAPVNIEPGEYTWTAYATDSGGRAGPATAAQRFTVAFVSFLNGTYVALGDSYSSGEGAPVETWENGWIDTWEAGTNESYNRCHRSSNAWPRLVGGTPEVPGRMVFVACSGAVTREVTTWGKYNEPKQLDAIPSDTTLVTMSIGGNDAGFADILKACIFTGKECNRKQEPYLARRLARLDAAPGTQPTSADRTADPGIDSVQPLSEVFQLLRGRAPYARVIIVGYPKFFKPGGHRGVDGRKLGCEAVFFDDQLWMNDAVARINDIIERRALARGFEYAHVEDAFNGHHLCDADPYMNGLYSPPWEEYSFHPNHKGHSVQSQIVHAKVLSP